MKRYLVIFSIMLAFLVVGCTENENKKANKSETPEESKKPTPTNPAETPGIPLELKIIKKTGSENISFEPTIASGATIFEGMQFKITRKANSPDPAVMKVKNRTSFALEKPIVQKVNKDQRLLSTLDIEKIEFIPKDRLDKTLSLNLAGKDIRIKKDEKAQISFQDGVYKYPTIEVEVLGFASAGDATTSYRIFESDQDGNAVLDGAVLSVQSNPKVELKKIFEDAEVKLDEKKNWVFEAVLELGYDNWKVSEDTVVTPKIKIIDSVRIEVVEAEASTA